MFDAGKLRSVESLSSAGQSSRAAEVGRVVGYSWMFDAGKLRSVESLSSAGQSSRAAEVGRSISPVMTVCCG